MPARRAPSKPQAKTSPKPRADAPERARPHPPQRQLVVTTMEAQRVTDPTTTEDFRLSGWHHGYGTVFVARHEGVMMEPGDYSGEEWVTSARAVITRNRAGHLSAGLAAVQAAWKDMDSVTGLVCREAWWAGFAEGAHEARRTLERGHRLKPELVAPDTRRASPRSLATLANGMKRFFVGG